MKKLIDEIINNILVFYLKRSVYVTVLIMFLSWRIHSGDKKSFIFIGIVLIPLVYALCSIILSELKDIPQSFKMLKCKVIDRRYQSEWYADVDNKEFKK